MLDRALRQAAGAGSTLGVTMAIVTDRGAWFGAAGTGMLGEPLTPRSSLMYASITKTFTAAEVVLLASRGDIDLDEPISDYVDFPAQNNGATVRQVLRMRSGLPAPEEEGLRSLLLQNPDRHWEPDETLADVPPDGNAARRPEPAGDRRYLLYGGHVLPPDLVASMHPLDDGTGHGFGTMLSESTLVPGLAFVGHDGDIGPYRSTLRVATDRPLSVAVLLLHDEEGPASPTAVAESLVAAL